MLLDKSAEPDWGDWKEGVERKSRGPPAVWLKQGRRYKRTQAPSRGRWGRVWLGVRHWLQILTLPSGSCMDLSKWQGFPESYFFNRKTGIMTLPVLWSCWGCLKRFVYARSCDSCFQVQDFNEGRVVSGPWGGRREGSLGKALLLQQVSRYPHREALWPWLTGRKGPGQLHQLLWSSSAPTHELCWGPGGLQRNEARDPACQWEDIVLKS